MTGIVLAGGRSSRFGSDKSLAAWNGRPMILEVLRILRPLFSSLLVVTKRPGDYSPMVGDARIVSDALPEAHPLVGIYSGLLASRSRLNFFCACDMPLLQPALVETLCCEAEGFDAAVPVWKGRPEPLCAVYSKSCLEPVRSLLRGKDSGIADLFALVRTRTLSEEEVSRWDPEGLSFIDIDTPEDYAKAEEALHAAPR